MKVRTLNRLFRRPLTFGFCLPASISPSLSKRFGVRSSVRNVQMSASRRTALTVADDIECNKQREKKANTQL